MCCALAKRRRRVANRSRADIAARCRAISRGVMGHRGSAHYVCPRTQAICHSLHVLFAWWSGSIAGPHERLGVIMSPDDKDAALLPRKINGLWALIHRPMTPLGAHIWISYSPDLRHWGNHKLMLEARRGAWWDANKIGMSPPPIETPRGWLMIYHGVRRTPSSSIYRLGLALFDLHQPEKCLIRGDSWMFAPEADYERRGDVQDVVFPCGYTVAEDGDTINLYYGAADSSIALAHGSIRCLLEWLDANGHSEQAHDRRLRQS